HFPDAHASVLEHVEIAADEHGVDRSAETPRDPRDPRLVFVAYLRQLEVMKILSFITHPVQQVATRARPAEEEPVARERTGERIIDIEHESEWGTVRRQCAHLRTGFARVQDVA